jgi:hypothetical protein
MRLALRFRSAIWIVVLVCGMALDARAQDAQTQALRAEIDRLRQELETMRQQYAERLAALEQKVAASSGAAPPASPPQAPPTTAVEVPPGAAGAQGPSGPLPVYGNVSALSKIFNPDIAMVGNFIGAGGSAPGSDGRAFDMRESELSLQAIVDPYARADFFLSFGSEGVDLEEGFITFNTLPGGLLVKAGKLKSNFGKVNTLHSHRLSWVDLPLVVNNLLGDEGHVDAGVSVSRLISNPWLFLEATGEVYRGQGGPFSGRTRRELSYVGRLRGYRDLTEDVNLDLGTSLAYGHHGAAEGVDGLRSQDAWGGYGWTTTLFGVDATLRVRPLRRATYRRFLGRTELMWSRRQEPGGDVTAFGTYVSGEYQLARRWFAGARFDYAERAVDASIRDKGGSVTLTFWPSEFSQVRGQFRRTRYGEGGVANEVLFQLLFSIGAHGAHVF